MTLIFNAITKYGAMTQVEIAENTGLSTATVSILVRKMVDDGTLTTSETIRSGRRALQVAIARQVGIGIGIHIGIKILQICITDFSQKILAEHDYPLPLNHKPDVTIPEAIRLIQESIDSIGASRSEIASIVIALACPVDWKHQQIGIPGILRG
ncbi:winged helix-turn-helix transcriptional regulator [Alloscardovia venturai]|uniref:Winged helix-turn-helix transcriptional regulator n=2 Tax=Alloscardovia venturai TaxID=1769421 RepID=A0ABW2Y696_9BIFI